MVVVLDILLLFLIHNMNELVELDVAGRSTAGGNHRGLWIRHRRGCSDGEGTR